MRNDNGNLKIPPQTLYESIDLPACPQPHIQLTWDPYSPIEPILVHCHAYGNSDRLSVRSYCTLRPCPCHECYPTLKIQINVNDEVHFNPDVKLLFYFDVELGYVLYQRRVDLSFVFNQTWASYKNGFGNICGNFWLGNEPAHQMTSKNGPCSLRLEIKPVDFSTTYIVHYLFFYIKPEANKYALNVTGFQSDLLDADKDALTPLNAMPFSTVDSWQSSCGINCPSQLGEGWWFKCCYLVNSVPSPTWHDLIAGELKFCSVWVKCPR